MAGIVKIKRNKMKYTKVKKMQSGGSARTKPAKENFVKTTYTKIKNSKSMKDSSDNPSGPDSKGNNKGFPAPIRKAKTEYPAIKTMKNGGYGKKKMK